MSNKLTKSVTILSAHQQMDVPTPFLKKTVFLSFNTAKKDFEKIQGKLGSKQCVKEIKVKKWIKD